MKHSLQAQADFSECRGAASPQCSGVYGKAGYREITVHADIMFLNSFIISECLPQFTQADKDTNYIFCSCRILSHRYQRRNGDISL